MDQSKYTSESTVTDSIVQGIIEGNDETTMGTQMIVRNISGTLSGSAAIVPDQISQGINKDKPWREVIKRRFINVGSDN